MSFPKVSLLLEGEHDHDQSDPVRGITMLIEPLTSSSTLIVGRSVTVFDTGTPPYRKRILARLREEGVRPKEVEYLILSHGHQDHWLNSSLYPCATIITEPNVQLVGGRRCEVFEDPIRHPDWEVMFTPGHTPMHLSLFVRGFWNGRTEDVVIAGDAFREDRFRDGYYESAVAKPGERESVMKVLDRAEVIIPGHYPVLEKRDLRELREMKQ